jgi:methyl-galactoside transport system substrate-binding protein
MTRLPFVLAATALLLASCSQAGKERPRLGLAMRSFDDAVSVAIRRSIETEALDKAQLAIIDGQNQQSAQDLQVASFFERKLGSIAIDPVDGNALGYIIGKAKAQGTPLVFFDRMPSGEAMRSWDRLFFVGTRAAEAGAAMGELLAEFWKENPGADRNKDGAAGYLVLSRPEKGSDIALLAESCTRALGAAGIGAKRLADGGGAPALIAKFGDRIEAVICADSGSALGAIAAFEAAGNLKGKKYIPILVAAEADPPQAIAEALSAGTLLGAALGDPASQGKAVFDLAYALAKNIHPSKAGWTITDAKYIWIPCRKIRGGASPARK